MKVKNDFILREIAGDYILVPVGIRSKEYNGLITLNEVGVLIWNTLQNDVSFDEIVLKVKEEYDIDEDTARNDIEEYISQLKTMNLIQDE